MVGLELNGEKWYGQTYRAFHGFGQAKFPDGCLVLGLSQFSIVTQLPLKTMLDLNVAKILTQN